MVLAAGLGQRMRPLTAETAKPLLPLQGRSLLDHALDRLALAGVEQVVVNAHWKAAKVAEALSAQSYATALYGKWHLGSSNGRLPNDQGFDEWYGIPRTTDEALWTEVMPPEQIMQGRKGEPSREVKVYDIAERRLMDAEITRRSIAFIRPHDRWVS